MAEYIMLMLGDVSEPEGDWDHYLDGLSRSGVLRGGSAIGAGTRHNKGRPTGLAEVPLTGFIRIECTDLAEAEKLLAGNPVYEAGGTVEIRLLPKDA